MVYCVQRHHIGVAGVVCAAGPRRDELNDDDNEAIMRVIMMTHSRW